MGFFSFSPKKKETLDKGLSKTKRKCLARLRVPWQEKVKVDDEVLIIWKRC